MVDRKRVKIKKTRKLILQFEHSDFEGIEVECNRAAPLGVVRAVQEAADEGDIDEMFRLLGEHVILAWNIDDDEGEIPPTAEGCPRVDMELLLTISREWTRALGAVDIPLAEPSVNGNTPAPALASMGDFTESPPNPSTTGG